MSDTPDDIAAIRARHKAMHRLIGHLERVEADIAKLPSLATSPAAPGKIDAPKQIAVTAQTPAGNIAVTVPVEWLRARLEADAEAIRQQIRAESFPFIPIPAQPATPGDVH